MAIEPADGGPTTEEAAQTDTATAGPTPDETPAPAPDEAESRSLAVDIARAMLDKKAEDVAILQVRQLIHITHYFVIGSGRNKRMVQAIADEIQLRTKKRGDKCLGQEGYRGAEWVLLDYVDVIAHVFLGPVREKYDLELHWGDAPRLPLPEPTRSGQFAPESAGGADGASPPDEAAEEDASA